MIHGLPTTKIVQIILIGSVEKHGRQGAEPVFHIYLYRDFFKNLIFKKLLGWFENSLAQMVLGWPSTKIV